MGDGDAAPGDGQAIFQQKIDVEEGLDATIRAALRRAARVSTGCRRRSGCADDLVRALRIARIAHLRRLLTEYDYVVSMDADSLACQKPDFAAPGAWDVALRPVRSLSGRPARDLPPYPPEFSGALLVLRNTTASRNLLATWAALYASYDDGKHPTSDQPPPPAPRFMKRARACATCPCATAARSGPPLLGLPCVH